MSWLDIKALKEQSAAKVQEARSLRDKAQTENRDLSNEEATTLDGLLNEQRALQDKIERLEALAKAEKSVEQRIGRESISNPVEVDRNEVRARKQAFRKLCLGGVGFLTESDKEILHRHSWANRNPEAFAEMEGNLALRALARGSDPGASLVPQDFYDRLYAKLKYFGGVLQSGAEVIETDTGAPLKIPVWDDTSNVGVMATAGSAVATNLDPTTSNLILQGWFVVSDILLANIDFLADQGVDIENYLADALAIRVGREKNAKYTTGAGTTEPQGVITGLSNAVTAASNTAIAYSDLVNLIYSVDMAYNDPTSGEECVFMGNQTTLGALRRLVDDNHRPLWQEGGSFGISNEPAYEARFMGYRYVVNNSMANIPASDPSSTTVSLLFGNFKRYYVIRQVAQPQLVTFQEYYMPQLAKGFMAVDRTDAIVRDTNAVWGLQHVHT